MSPKIGEVDGIEISIKSLEHGNPHIHAWYQGEKVKIFIETLDVESGRFPPQQLRKLMKWIQANQKYLIDQWDEIVNSP
jgi:hypothetical protein